MSESTPKNKITDGVIISEDGKTLIKMPVDAQKSCYAVPDGVEIIDAHAFENCNEVTTIILPEGLREIKDEAFINCTKLSSINIPSELYSIGYGLFTGCDSLSTLKIECDIYDTSMQWDAQGISFKCIIYIDDEDYKSGYINSTLAFLNVLPISKLTGSTPQDQASPQEGEVSSVEEKENAEDCAEAESDDIIEVDVDAKDFDKLLSKRVKILGNVRLNTISALSRCAYNYIDISEATFGIEEERWSTFLGFSHHGPVNGNSGWRDVEVLKRFLEQINAHTILLPDDVQRRHINAAKKNPHIKELQVRTTCPIFAYEDGKLMNKKKTKPVFGCKAYTVTGEIRGTWDSYDATVDIPLSDAEVERVKKLVAKAKTYDFLSILKGEIPKLFYFLDDYFHDLAYKEKVRDGLGYGLSRREAENVCMTGNEYFVFIPDEFLE